VLLELVPSVGASVIEEGIVSTVGLVSALLVGEFGLVPRLLVAVVYTRISLSFTRLKLDPRRVVIATSQYS
jgi:hypothetical protein